MRQISLEAPGRLIEKQVEKPLRQEGEALVRIRKVGVCGSDFHAYNGKHPIYTYPRVMGHELSGIIAEIPENNLGLKVGDNVSIEPYIPCGECRACKAGRTNCCERIRLFGVHIDGGMQPFLSVPLYLLHKSEKLSLEQLALIETLSIGAHAVARSGLLPTEEALIIGAGPIGIATAQFAAATGAKTRVVEKNELRRKFMEDLGIEAVNSAEGLLADVVFDATGSAAVMAQSLYNVATGGRLVFVGLTTDPISVDDPTLHRREVTLLASRNSVRQFPRIIKMIEEGKIDTASWITHRLTLPEMVEKFPGLPGTPTLIKAVVDVQDSDL